MVIERNHQPVFRAFQAYTQRRGAGGSDTHIVDETQFLVQSRIDSIHGEDLSFYRALVNRLYRDGVPHSLAKGRVMVALFWVDVFHLCIAMGLNDLFRRIFGRHGERSLS